MFAQLKQAAAVAPVMLIPGIAAWVFVFRTATHDIAAASVAAAMHEVRADGSQAIPCTATH